MKLKHSVRRDAEGRIEEWRHDAVPSKFILGFSRMHAEDLDPQDDVHLMIGPLWFNVEREYAGQFQRNHLKFHWLWMSKPASRWSSSFEFSWGKLRGK